MKNRSYPLRKRLKTHYHSHDVKKQGCEIFVTANSLPSDRRRLCTWSRASTGVIRVSGSTQPLRSSSSGRFVWLNGTADVACFHQPDQTEGCFHQHWGMHPLRGIEGAGGCNRWSYRGRELEGTTRNHAPSLRQYRLQLNHSRQMFTYLFFTRNREGRVKTIYFSAELWKCCNKEE